MIKFIDWNFKQLRNYVEKMTNVSIYFIKTAHLALTVDIIIQIILFYSYIVFSYWILLIYLIYLIKSKKFDYLFKAIYYFRIGIIIIIISIIWKKYLLLFFPILLIIQILKNLKNIKLNKIYSLLVSISKFIRALNQPSRKRIKYVVKMTNRIKNK
jgi:hypothetical protein